MRSLLSPTRKENQGSQSSLRHNRDNTHRVLKPLPSSNSVLFNDRQITQQLREEFAAIADLLNRCEISLRGCELVERQKNSLRQLIDLE